MMVALRMRIGAVLSLMHGWACGPAVLVCPARRGPPLALSIFCSVGAAGQDKCHVWTAPSWQELSSRLQHWSVQPCVRPLDAVYMTAGHNALRGSGPGQNLAF